MSAHYPVHEQNLRAAGGLGRRATPLLAAARASARRLRDALRALACLFEEKPPPPPRDSAEPPARGAAFAPAVVDALARRLALVPPLEPSEAAALNHLVPGASSVDEDLRRYFGVSAEEEAQLRGDCLKGNGHIGFSDDEGDFIVDTDGEDDCDDDDDDEEGRGTMSVRMDFNPSSGVLRAPLGRIPGKATLHPRRKVADAPTALAARTRGTSPSSGPRPEVQRSSSAKQPAPAPPSLRAAATAAASAAAERDGPSFLSILCGTFIRLLLWPVFILYHIGSQVARYRADALERATLLLRLETSRTYREWHAAALALDAHDGAAEWKQSTEPGPIAPVCDVAVVSTRLDDLCAVYSAGDANALAFTLRQGLVRNFAGMCHPEVHSCATVGTKAIIEDYVNVVAFMLLHLAHSPSPEQSTGDKLKFFNEARHAFGRTALMLSGGAAMGLNHLGVVKTLLEHDLLPRVVSGTSAGAIVAAMVGLYTDDELFEILQSEDLVNPRTGVSFVFRYFDESLSIWTRIRRLLRKGAMEDVRMLQDCLRKNLGDVTFGEAYRRTRRIVNITVCPASGSSGPPLLLNYLTAPNVLVWSATSASCALPYVFGSVELVAKNNEGRLVPYLAKGARWIDGSVTSDVPLARIGELFNVNHFIVSQTNPHVIPRGLPLFQTRLALLIKSEVQFRYWQALQLRLIPSFLTSLLPHMMQPYEGDVTIMPEVNLRDLAGLFRNPTIGTVHGFVQRGERQTFPLLDRVRLHCLVERALDTCVEVVAQSAKQSVAAAAAAAAAASASASASASVGAVSAAPLRLPIFGRVPSWLWVDSNTTESPPPERRTS